MLKIYDKNHNAIGHIVKYKDCKIESEVATGDKTLSFVYLAKHHNLQNEMYVQTKDDEYVIKEVPATTGAFPQIVAVLNLEDLQRDMWQTFSVTDATIDEAVRTVLAGTGWTIGECDVVKRRNAGMMQVSTLEVIQNLCTAFMCEPVFDTIGKKVSFYSQRGEDKGVYFMPGLNLKKLQKKSTSYDYYTRIIPVGQDSLSIADVNDGKNYLENYQYSSKVLTYIWKDESYTDPQALMEDAQLKLNDLSKPEVSYSADVRDLAKQKPEYNVLSYKLGDTVTIIDQETDTREKQRIKKMVEYPQDPEKNTCEIANTVLTFEEMQQKYQAAINIINNTVTGDGRYTGTINVSDILNFEKGLAGSSTIGGIQGDIADMEGDLVGIKLTIGQIDTNFLKAEEADLKYATIENLNVVREDVHDLNADYATFKVATADEFAAHTAILDNLDTKYASIDLANIDTANIDKAKVATLFAEMGLISTAVIENGHVTGYLDSVEVNANRITAGTLSVDRLIINGSDKSLIYALNNAGELVSTSVDTLDGGLLTKRTVTADKLVAHSITANEITTSNIIGASGWINLAQGTFNYNNQISWDGKKLYIAPENIEIAISGKYSTIDYVDSSKESAIASAAIDATTKADAAQTAAIASAAADATSKADSALSSAKSYADTAIATVDGKFASYSTTVEMQSAIEVAKTEINLAVSESYTTKQEFGALEIGGRNLLYGDGLLALYSNDSSIFPIRCVKTEESGITFYRITRTNIDLSPTVISLYNAIRKNDFNRAEMVGKQVTLSFKARASRSVEASFMNYAVLTDGTHINFGKQREKITTTWKTFYITIDNFPDNVEVVRWCPYSIYITKEEFYDFYLDVRDWKFEKGNKPTDWTPAPEDTDAKITSLETWKTEASQKITKDGIIATVGNYYAYQSDLAAAENRITQAESTIVQQANEIALTVKEQDVTGNYIVGKLNLSSTTAKIAAKNIDLSGYVTVSSLKTAGATTIDGSNITTGTISADRIDAESLMAKKLTATNLTVTGNSKFSGVLDGATGTFAGSLSAATGSFSGAVTATSGKIGNWNIAGAIDATTSAGNYIYLGAGTNGNQDVLVVRTGTSSYSYPVVIRATGEAIFKNANITGAITATSITAKNEYYIHASSGTGTKARALYAADGSIGSTLMVGDGFSTLHLCGLLVDKNSGQVLCGEDGSWGLTAGSVRAQGFDYGGQFNAQCNGYGTIFRNDGSAFYILLSNQGSPDSFNGLRPFIMNLASGKVEVKTDFYCTSWGSGTTVRRPVGSASGDGKQIQWIESKKNSSGTYYITVNGQFAGSDFSSKNINCTTSDIRLKTNVVDCNMDALSIINQIQVREFDWKESGIHQKIGFVADELEAIDSNLAFGGGYNEDGSMDVKSVNEFYLVGYLTKGIQELHTAQLAQADELLTHKSQIDYLLDENAKLKKRVKELEKQIA